MTTNPKNLKRVDFQDVTGQIMELDVHGTRCGFNLGTDALFSVRVPATQHVCSPTNEMEIVIPTDEQSASRIMLPAQLAYITFEAVTPAWPEVTDFSGTGYFHRRRNRTQRFDLYATSVARLEAENGQGSDAGQATSCGQRLKHLTANNEPVAQWEYHPPPQLTVTMAQQPADGQEVDVSAVAAITGCPAVAASDRQLGGDPVVLTVPGTNPAWAVAKGERVVVTTSVIEQVPDRVTIPTPSTPQTCSWVELDDTDADNGGDPNTNPLVITHRSNLGFSNADISAFSEDPTTAERKAINEVLTKTLGFTSQETSLGTELKKCRTPDSGREADCHVEAIPSGENTQYTSGFGTDHRCLIEERTGRGIAGWFPLQIVESVCAASEATVCAAQWATQSAIPDGRFRAWHDLAFTSLSSYERGQWQLVPAAAAAYQRADNNPNINSWNAFSQAVYVDASPAWKDLSLVEKTALARLHFTSETWGRHWALLERIFQGEVGTLLWEDQTAAEQSAMSTLGWTATTWDDSSAQLPAQLLSAGTPVSVKLWSRLTAVQQARLEAVRVTGSHWNNQRQLTVPVTGCFWHQAHGSVKHVMHTKGPFVPGSVATTAAPSSPPTTPPQRQRRAATTGGGTARPPMDGPIPCPPGLFSDAQNGYYCAPCGPDRFKSAGMNTSDTCVGKRVVCRNPTHVLHKRFQLFGSESAIEDDTRCTPPGYCPPGTERRAVGAQQPTCVACPAGTYSAGDTQGLCRPKTVVACPKGYFWVQGTSWTHDDNMCVVCPAGAFAAAPSHCSRLLSPGAAGGSSLPPSCNASTTYTGSVCVAKAYPTPACAAGQFVALGHSTTSNDHACATCAAGQFTSTNNTAVQCQQKAIGSCLQGEYFHTQHSPIADDNVCLPCPVGTFSSSVSSLSTCKPKFPAHCKTGTELFVGVSTSTNDNACVPPRTCPPGYAKDAATGRCAECTRGTYSDVTSGAAACKDKALVCYGAGRQVRFGPSKIINDARCVACPAGTFNNGTSRFCSFKQPPTRECPEGFHVGANASPVRDDSQCQACAPGQFTPGPTTTQRSCRPKIAPVECNPGEFLISTLPADYPGRSLDTCWSAPLELVVANQRGNTSSHQCFGLAEAKRKCREDPNCFGIAAERTLCSNNITDFAVSRSIATPHYRLTRGNLVIRNTSIVPPYTTAFKFNRPCATTLGLSQTTDDWICSSCPTGKYTNRPNTDDQCLPKTQQAACTSRGLVLKKSFSLAQDNSCHEAGACPPGEQVAANGIDCEACVPGKYNPVFTRDKSACISKVIPAMCAAGQRLVIGASVDRDDWRCSKCLRGQYRSTPTTNPAAVNPANVPSDLQQCISKTPKAGTAVDKDPGSVYAYGTSIYEDDWGYVPNPAVRTLCKRKFKSNTQSELSGLRVGMPELLLPFTKDFIVELPTPGHPRTAVRTAVVVTGDRFVSSAERVPVPQSRPLLVLHDPPGQVLLQHKHRPHREGSGSGFCWLRSMYRHWGVRAAKQTKSTWPPLIAIERLFTGAARSRPSRTRG